MPVNYCWNCGEKLEDEIRFCPRCGTSIQAGDETQRMSASAAGTPETPETPKIISEIIDVIRKWTQGGLWEILLAQQSPGTLNASEGPRDYAPAYEPSGPAEQFHKLMISAHLSAPSPEANNAEALRRDLPLKDKAQVVGTWFYQLQTPYGVANYQLFMDSTKNFTCQTTMNGLMAYDSGEYQHQDDFVHFVVKKHEPKVRNGKKEHWLTSWGYYYKVVDADKLLFEDRLVGGRFYVYRVKGQ
jgi:hypothetical protein